MSVESFAIAPAVARSKTAIVVRALDLGLALVVLLLATPLLAVIALAVRLESPGGAIFRQRRLGREGRTFVVNKFRTMRADADERVHRDYVHTLISGEQVAVSDGRRSLYKLAVDDRITRVGRLLRKLSLDELPQLWNVVRGEMSLVGPRPVIAYEADEYPAAWRRRFAVKPGVTGLWQVSGRNERTYEEMVELDLEFVRRYSVWLYVTILARTVWVVLAGRGAA